MNGDLVSSGTYGNLDEEIAQLMQCKPLSEKEGRGQLSLTRKNSDLPSSPFPSSPDYVEQANPMILKWKMTRRPDSEGQNKALVHTKLLKKGKSLNPVGMEIDPKTSAIDKDVQFAIQDFENPATESATSPENPVMYILKPWGNIKARTPREFIEMKINTPASEEQRPREVANLTGVKQHPSAEAKKRRGRPPKKSIDGAKKKQRRKPDDRIVKGSGQTSGANLCKQSLVNYVSDNVSSQPRQVEMMSSESLVVAVKGVEEQPSERVVDMVNLNKKCMFNVATGNVSLPSRQVKVVVPASSSVAVKGAKPQSPIVSTRVAASGNIPSPCRQIEVMMSENSHVADVSDSASMNKKETSLLTTHDVAPRTDPTAEGEVRVPPPPGNVDPKPIMSLQAKLPFRKTSALWREVESLEVFLAIPQDPHFALVEKQFGKDFSEGMAIGLMVTFDNVVKDIRKLDVTDSNQAFEDRLRSLRILEENGFSVECLRTRIVELLGEKIRLSEIKNKTTTLKEKVFGVRSERDQIGVTSSVIDKIIDEMTMDLARLNEKKQDLVTQEILKEAELKGLEKQVGENDKAYCSGVQQFRKIAAAPW